MHNLSQNLKQLLTQAKLSENELSRRTGVPQQVINRILTGKNLNPKIATLSPLADYFTISISQLLGDGVPIEEPKLNIQHMGWIELPLIEWNIIGTSSFDKLMSDSKEKVVIDMNNTGSMFATRMVDNSMEPKFSQKTLLIFDSKKMVNDKDFVLIYTAAEHELVLRQIFVKKTGVFQKCFNPKYKDYKLTPILPESKYWGVLIQSRTEHCGI